VEECSCVGTNSFSSWWSYPCCFWCRGSTPKLFLLAGRGGEGEDSNGVAAALHWMRCHKCFGAAPASSTPPSMRRSSWEALQQGTLAGIIALPLHPMDERRPFSRSRSSTGRLLSGSSPTVLADRAPSGLFPGVVEGSRWRSLFSGEDKDLIAFLVFPLGSCIQTQRVGLLFPVLWRPFL
jgi:hypothetical protein